jgi:hypothetical protein
MKNLLAICTLSLMAGTAVAQAPTQDYDRSTSTGTPLEARSSALSAIFAHADRILRSRSALGPSGNRIEVRECLQLLPLLSSSRAPGGGVIGQGSGGGVLDQGSGGAVFASISIKCGNTVFQVSTGTLKVSALRTATSTVLRPKPPVPMATV